MLGVCAGDAPQRDQVALSHLCELTVRTRRRLRADGTRTAVSFSLRDTRRAPAPTGRLARGLSGSRPAPRRSPRRAAGAAPPTSWPSRFSAAFTGIGLIVTPSDVDERLQLLVDRARGLDVALLVEADHLLHAPRDEVAVDDDAADAADLEERVDEVVAARVERRARSRRRCAAPGRAPRSPA